MLTHREREAAALLARGQGRRELAEALAISVSGADKLVRSLKVKLGAANRGDLALRCREIVEDRPSGTPLEQRVRTVPEAGAEGAFHEAWDIDDLFARLIGALEPLGITHVVYSHIRRDSDGGIAHLATRWSFPPDVTFDYTIPAEQNLAFRHAMENWAPAPLDLEAMAASDLYDHVPEAIRRQNEIFLAAGMVRGVTFALPGLTVHDRLVLSTLMRYASAPRFQDFLRLGLDRASVIITAFRNAHVGLARPRIALEAREREAVIALSEGLSGDTVAARLGVSRRAADRILAEARKALGSPTNAGAVAAFLRAEAEPPLPF